ncbi:MAG TPA: VWA domain-containing protein [Candidatus Lokiarchaeia archaeon]|nr:VWA domain-containing protein [Candidatus Lokiarchaeia archaeon]
MPGLTIEDNVILIDTSRSMLRADFTPSRLAVTMRASLELIAKKFEIDPNDRLSIVTFGNKAQKISDFSSKKQILFEALKNVEPGGVSDIADGLALSIQLLATEMRKMGGKVVRILLFSDDRLGTMTNKLIKLGNAAKGLGIFIDCLVAGRPAGAKNFSVMKNLATITGGDFAYFTNTSAYFKAIVGLSSKKDLNDVAGYYEAQEKVRTTPLLSEIAVELRRPNIQEIQDMIANPQKIKCNICYKSESNGRPAYATMRYCPSCARPMHLVCTAQWAKNSPDARDDVFRCPFCYFLIKNTGAMLLTKTGNAVKQGVAPSGITSFTMIPREDIPDIDSSCGHCHNVFLGEYDVFRCDGCGTYYHKPCVKEVQDKFGACRVCGKQIKNIKEILG